MEDNSKGHIDTAELAKLLEESRGHPQSALDLPSAHPHLAACRMCREQFEGLSLMDRQLQGMRPRDSGPGPDDCPGPDLWREVAGGLTPPEDALGPIEHASRCGHCGPLLHQAIAEIAALNGEITEAERKHIATLESARAKWQRKLAQRITATPFGTSDPQSAPWWKRPLAVPRLAIAGASLLSVVAAGSWVVFQRNQPTTASHLLAGAYTEKRTLELRIAGAAYAPLRISRGPAGSFTSRPAQLLTAEALIAAQLQSHPSDPSWLQAKAQADVLEGKYDAAVETLHRALALQPDSPALLTDLATAHFQRALGEDRKEDFGAAFEYLSQALDKAPDDPVALFNRAIVSEHQFLYQRALEDWDLYLRLDSGSQWADEARSHAGALREKLKQHGSNTKPLLAPEQVVGESAADSGRTLVDQRIEEYLHEAILSWLPLAFPQGDSETSGNADSSARQALFFLAELTKQKHGDDWLADLLRGSPSPDFPRAVASLARSVKADDAGDYDTSLQQSDLAEQLFRVSGNTAGVLRAKFERTFVAQIERRSEQCRRQARAALTESERHSYPWLQIQLGLETSVCFGLMNEIGTGEKAAQRAMDRAQEHGYGALYLRALGFLVEDRLETGDQAGGAKLTSVGLESYWSSPYPAMRGYNLYSEVADNAEASSRQALRVAAWREALSLIDSEQDLLLRAMAHISMANAATAAHLPSIAEQHYTEAARLFAAAPRTDASRNATLEAEVRTAQLQAHQFQFDEAIMRLTRIQNRILSLSNNYLAQLFYSTLGELQLGRHHEAEAEQSLRPALALAEQNLATIGSQAKRTRWSADAAPAYLALIEAEIAQGRSQEALETYEWYLGAPQRLPVVSRRPPSSSGPLMAKPPTLATRFPTLAKETVLAYAALPHGLAIWVYDDRGMNSRWIQGSTDGMQESAERFHGLCSDPGSEASALRRDARSLYVSLIAPVEQYLTPGRTLVIESEGWLVRVPFEALLDSNGHYLIERAAVVHSLGQESEAQLHSDTGISAGIPALVVGSTASSSNDELTPLPDAAEEADAVGRSFHFARVLKGADANLTAVRNALPGVALFHFAGHSLATSNRAGLLLRTTSQISPPQLLDAEQLRRTPLPNLQLAALSACNTSNGSGGSGGFNSVTEALLRSGVPHVVASRWAVVSPESREFTGYFYRNLLAGASVSEAVRLTSLELLSHSQTSHPYYWSAFAAYGRP